MDFKEKHEFVKQMFKDGKSTDEIEKATGYKWNTIKIILNKGGISYATKTKYDYTGVKEMREQGMSASEISKKTNIPSCSIRTYLSRNGLSVSQSLAPPVEREPIADIKMLKRARPRMNRIAVVNGKKYVDVTETIFNQPDLGEEISLCMTN